MTIGNGLIAAFVAGITMGVAEHEITDSFVEFAENLSAIFQAVTFFVFGALIYAVGYAGEVWQLALFIAFALLVARPVAISIAFVRARIAKFQFIDDERSRALADDGGGDLHSKLSEAGPKLSTPTEARRCEAHRRLHP